jgi:hypothetical protein
MWTSVVMFNIQFINFLKEIQKKEEGVDKFQGISDILSITVTDQESIKCC